MCLSVTAEIAKGPLASCETIVDRAEPSVAGVLGRLATIAEAFARAYHQRVQAVMPHWRPLFPRSTNLRFSGRSCHHSRSSIMMFNHAIIRLACLSGIPWLDVRLTCYADVGNAPLIEVSVASGVKIVYVISTFAREYNFNRGRPSVYVWQATSRIG
jgi:hypothetical protein